MQKLRSLVVLMVFSKELMGLSWASMVLLRKVGRELWVVKAKGKPGGFVRF